MGLPGNRGSWGPCVLVHTQTTPKKNLSWGPLLTPSPWAVPEYPNGQSAPARSFSEHRTMGV
ncbi:unnamed protein product [Staurois parvus]|uniref:Uncharacterized protein n=1 Tax=Staurois parvus TaxID=386267 RepID=A0ABN9H1T3_9NEOB|nr:unnamed protein product [Staurois parvus]